MDSSSYENLGYDHDHDKHTYEVKTSSYTINSDSLKKGEW